MPSLGRGLKQLQSPERRMVGLVAGQEPGTTKAQACHEAAGTPMPLSIQWTKRLPSNKDTPASKVTQ